MTMVTNFMQLVQINTSGMPDSEGSGHPNEEDKLVNLLRALPELKGAEDRFAVWFAAGSLVATASNRVRNAAALALADMGGRDAGRMIVEVLRRPDIAKVSGTLLYALRELGASIPLSVIVGLIENGSYESRATALEFLKERQIERPDRAELDDARKRLTSFARDGDESEGAEAAQVALEYLDETAKR
jgi:hypothetical protein